MTEIDTQKDFFLFPHGNMGLKQKITDVLVAKGCSEAKITMGVGTKVGNVGDYMVQLWPPGPAPNQIKIQQITKVEDVEPEGMVGLWKGVSKEDVESISLE
ncbi:MAG: hypothetical protein HOC38_01090 [Nitrosopumilus sp.]|jgi:hypothetical protein|nr:hypothetical protein [Nitrosopumilus sp.]MBT4216492.1 hypothetical protein [Nitrosopumilus sp.]MBT4550281.1 hypothetical protein [Nitrosopumilus sp.]MBT7474300.1 hypothetical protein [Nitrosopumilus sp.]